MLRAARNENHGACCRDRQQQLPLEGLVDHRRLGPTPEFLIQQIGARPENSMSPKFMGDVDIAGLGPHCETTAVKM